MAQKAKTDRTSVLKAAWQLLAESGLGGLSIRAVANQLGLAPNAIYHYFESLESLRNTVAAQVCGELLSQLQRACDGKAPIRSIRALADAYLTFAKDEEHLYEALLLPRPEGENAVLPERLWFFVVAEVRRVSGCTAAPEAAVALWAVLHGLASLELAHAFNAEKPRSSIEFALDTWIAAARAAALRERKSHRIVDRPQEVFVS